MTIEDFLSRLDGVRRTGHGWVGRCPAHDDHDPSLSVREGEQGLLVRCWAGCELSAICDAIGITPRELFYDAGRPVDREAIRRHQAKRQAERTRRRAQGKQVDAFREAEAVLRAAINPGLAGWSDEQVEVAMNCVCDAYGLLLRERTDATGPQSASA